MKITAKHTEFLLSNVRARMPFRYGIATLTRVPHLVVRMTVDIDGKVFTGLSADNLPPKWFTKNPDQSFEDELKQMFIAIRSAAGIMHMNGTCSSVFELWHQVYATQREWGEKNNLPPLLWNLGVSLIERAVIDAVCKASGKTFGDVVRSGILGIDFGELHPKLKGILPADVLPVSPLRKLYVRHTVGLSDPLTDDEIRREDRATDDLPQSLSACIRHYNLRYFKIKLSGDIPHDIARLKQIAKLIEGSKIHDYRFTLDGNEQYTDVASLQSFWVEMKSDRTLTEFISRLIVIEQPIHREMTLRNNFSGSLQSWGDRPPLIIDESDDSLNSLERALHAGYAGTSYKNCKGVIKGLYNAAMLELYRRENPGKNYFMTGEDLTNIGPVALNQDLAVMSNLGIEHAERNGHHYFYGLQHFSKFAGLDTLKAHEDLYEKSNDAIIVRIRDGIINIGSVVDAPFGVGFEPDLTGFISLDEWKYDSLM